MSRATLEKRVEALESIVAELQAEIRSGQKRRIKDWRKTIGIFGDNEGMKQLFQEALRLREADRRKARRAAKTKASR